VFLPRALLGKEVMLLTSQKTIPHVPVDPDVARTGCVGICPPTGEESTVEYEWVLTAPSRNPRKVITRFVEGERKGMIAFPTERYQLTLTAGQYLLIKVRDQRDGCCFVDLAQYGIYEDAGGGAMRCTRRLPNEPIFATLSLEAAKRAHLGLLETLWERSK
jgi:hypothetical protein